MNRRYLYIFVCIGLILVIGCSPASNTKNILVILVEDYGYNDLIFNNNSVCETPNLDRFAKESMVFKFGYASCQVSSPSRASIKSGRFPARHGITDGIGASTGIKWRKKNRHDKLIPPEYSHNLSKE